MAEIILPQDRLFLLDLDETLIDKNYQFTKSGIREKVAALKELGWQVGLSSDTPLEALEIWQHKIGSDGPLIFEKGAAVKYDHQCQRAEGSSLDFIKSRIALESELRKKGILVWKGNPVDAIRNGITFENSNHRQVVLVNSLRRYSLSIHPREVDANGQIHLNDQLTQEIAQLTMPLLPEEIELDLDINLAYGIFIAAGKNTTKRVGTQLLLSEMRMKKVGMVGNSMSDFVGGDIALHYAVANASQDLKDRSVYIAQDPLTAGVMEILSLAESSNG